MYSKFYLDISVYDKKDILHSKLTAVILILFSLLMAYFSLRIPLNFEYDHVSCNSIRDYSSVMVAIIYIASYGIAFTVDKTKKLYLASISIGVIVGCCIYIAIIFISDMNAVFLRASSIASVSDKSLFIASYFTDCYFQYIPFLITAVFVNILRMFMKGRGFTASEKNSGMYGSAEFADMKYLKEKGIVHDTINTKFSLFGRDAKLKKYLAAPICNRTVIAKPGGGKTTGVTIPALLTENRPCFVHDPKGELWAVTAAFRIKNFSRNIITVDPFGVTEDPLFKRGLKGEYGNILKRVSINPLSYVPESEEYKDRFITSLVSALVKSENSKFKSESSSHFTEICTSIISGLIEFVVDLKKENINTPTDDDELNLPQLNELNSEKTRISNNIKFIKEEKEDAAKDIQEKLNVNEKYFKEIELKIQDLMDSLIPLDIRKLKEEYINRTPNLFDVYMILNSSSIMENMKFIITAGGIRAKQAAANLLSTGENERGSILSTSRRQLSWLSDSNLRTAFTQNSCDLRDFVKGNHDIYIIMPEDQIKEQSRVIRMILSMITSFLIQCKISELSENKYLFLLDELGQLDYNPDIETAISILRGRKCVFWSIFQTYSQIEKYEKPDLFTDTGMLQFFSVGDPKIMQMVQKMGGRQTKLIERTNHSDSKSRQTGNLFSGNSSESSGTSVYEIGTDLIHFNEIRELPKDEQYVFIDSMKVIHCKKLKYFDDDNFKDYDLNPLESSSISAYPIQNNNQNITTKRSQNEEN